MRHKVTGEAMEKELRGVFDLMMDAVIAGKPDAVARLGAELPQIVCRYLAEPLLPTSPNEVAAWVSDGATSDRGFPSAQARGSVNPRALPGSPFPDGS